MTGFNFLVTVSKTSVTLLQSYFVLSRNYQVIHGINYPSACILVEHRSLPSWLAGSTALLRIVRTHQSWWDMCVSFAVVILTLKIAQLLVVIF